MSPSTCPAAAGSGLGGRTLSVVFVVALVVACGAPRERFAGTFDSPEALTDVFLQALAAGDRPRLESLVVSRQEFELEVFPQMPAYGNIPADLAWGQISARNLQGLSRVLSAYAGRSWELEEIRFPKGSTAYQTFVVHRQPMLRLRDRRTGERVELALFGSFLEDGGRYKLLSFNVDR